MQRVCANYASPVLSLRELLELRVALPAGFSDDGESVLVLSNRTDTMQLYWIPRAGGELVQLTDFDEPVTGQVVPGAAGRILLSIDEGGNERGQLHLLDPGGERRPFAVDPEAIHRSESISFDGRLVGYVSNRRNGVDFDVYVQPLAGEARLLAELGGWCDTVGFSPDGHWLAVSKLTERSGDNDLYLVGVKDGEVTHVSPHDDEAVFDRPVWRADSRSFLVATSTGRDTTAIARYDLEAGRFEYVIEDEWDLSAFGDRSGRHLLVEANEDGYSRVELRDPETLGLRARVPLPGRGVAQPFVFSPDGRLLAYHFTSPRKPGDVWLYDTEAGEAGESVRLTRSAEEELLASMPEPELHRFDSFDDETIPVFLSLPDRPDPAPVIVSIHGGPEAQARPVWSAVTAYWVSRGFAVAVPNVRGSTGYGKRYEHLDDRHKRLDSVRDLASLHNWLAESDAVDASRIALAGGSYGGYMVLAGLAFHPELFAAGVDIVGISSLVTFLENTSVWRRAFREREYGSLATDRELLEQVSPITHVDRIRAPLFVIHGANDPRVPLSEAQQLHAELERRGVASELLVYDDEGHGLQKLKNRLDAYPRVADFLERVLEPALR